MIPGEYDLELYDGDSYLGPLLVLPDLSPFGGPSTLVGATVKAEVRASFDEDLAHPFAVSVIDSALRQLRLALTPSQVLALPGRGVWDLQVTQGEFAGTVLAGKVKKRKQVTR